MPTADKLTVVKYLAPLVAEKKQSIAYAVRDAVLSLTQAGRLRNGMFDASLVPLVIEGDMDVDDPSSQRGLYPGGAQGQYLLILGGFGKPLIFHR